MYSQNNNKGVILYKHATITKIDAKRLDKEYIGAIPYSLHFFETNIVIIIHDIKLSRVKPKQKSNGIL